MKTGSIILVDTEGLVQSTIDRVQGNDYNHAGFVVNLYGETYIFEAIKSGMAFTNIKDYIKETEEKDVNLLLLEPIKWDVEEKELMNFILPLTQRPYGFTNLLIYQLIKYVFNVWIGRSREKSTKRFICGKLVAYIYNHFTGLFPDWHKVAPVDLFNSKEFKHKQIKQ